MPRSTLITAKMAAAFVLIAAAFLTGLLLGVLVLAIQGFEVWGRAESLAPFLIAAGLALRSYRPAVAGGDGGGTVRH